MVWYKLMDSASQWHYPVPKNGIMNPKLIFSFTCWMCEWKIPPKLAPYCQKVMMSKAQFYSYLLSLRRHFLRVKMGKDFIHCSLGGDAGGLPYKSDGDTPCLAQGCKLQVLVSLRPCLGQKVTIFAHSGMAQGRAQRNLQKML